MTGSTSCYRRRTFGPPLQPGVRSTRKSHLYNPGYAQRGNLSASIQQRAEKAAGLSSVDGCQVMVGGAT